MHRESIYKDFFLVVTLLHLARIVKQLLFYNDLSAFL